MLQSIAAIVSLIGIVVYFVGWTYLHSYFDFFRIDEYEIDPSVQYVLVYAFPPLRYAAEQLFWQRWAVITLLVIGGFGLWAVAYAPPAWVRAARIAATVASLIWVFAVAYNSAWQAGIKDARTKWMEDSNPVVLNGSLAKEECSGPPAGMRTPLSCHNIKLRLHEILSTPRYHYVFMREDCQSQRYRSCGGLVFRVAVDGLSYVTALHAGEPR